MTISVKPTPIRDPERVMAALVAENAQLIYARDPGLAAALDVPPPPVDPSNDPMHGTTPSAASEGRNLPYRAARKIYRKLKHVALLQPILETIRNEVRRRF